MTPEERQAEEEMRKALMCLRLEIPPSIADDICTKFEAALLNAWDAGYGHGYANNPRNNPYTRSQKT